MGRPRGRPRKNPLPVTEPEEVKVVDEQAQMEEDAEEEQ